ncbi:MAG: N-acyl-D-amino-acid deacylase [Shewanella sp.]|jgi:N-acyl-D-amino-acid deacylase
MPKWVMADSQKAFFERLNDPSLYQQLNSEITENLRRRGGGKALLITAFNEQNLVGETLGRYLIRWHRWSSKKVCFVPAKVPAVC